MPDYQRMYYTLCAAASHALDILPASSGNAKGCHTLKAALLEAEDIYIETADVIDFPCPADADTCEEDILSRLRACSPGDRRTALRLLDVYLNSLDQ